MAIITRTSLSIYVPSGKNIGIITEAINKTVIKGTPLQNSIKPIDKEIINFISANGGRAYESELRKKFLQPRTTMWRAVKRLERHGIVEIEKKDLQNIVKLKSKLEDS